MRVLVTVAPCAHGERGKQMVDEDRQQNANKTK
jgi:hypothetical protein